MKLNFKKIYKDVLLDPLYIVFHPIKGFDEFKFYGMGKMYVANLFLILATILRIISYNLTGFLFNTNNPDEFNAITLALYVIVPVLLFSVSNWSVTTLMDGKGSIKEIYMMICYSLFPLILLGFPSVLLSNVITIEEASVYQLLTGISIFVFVYLLFFGLIGIHEFSVSKTLGIIILTFVAFAVLIFIFLLFFSLIQDMFNFISRIIFELKLKVT